MENCNYVKISFCKIPQCASIAHVHHALLSVCRLDSILDSVSEFVMTIRLSKARFTTLRKREGDSLYKEKKLTITIHPHKRYMRTHALARMIHSTHVLQLPMKLMRHSVQRNIPGAIGEQRHNHPPFCEGGCNQQRNRGNANSSKG